MQDRRGNYSRGDDHPSGCTCVQCSERRLLDLRQLEDASRRAEERNLKRKQKEAAFIAERYLADKRRSEARAEVARREANEAAEGHVANKRSSKAPKRQGWFRRAWKALWGR